MPPSDLLPERLLDFTLGHGLGTPGMEAAASGWIERTGHIATEEDAGLRDAGLGRGHRREQGLRCNVTNAVAVCELLATLRKAVCRCVSILAPPQTQR